MGFELGPGFLRRPPRGWLPARAHALEFVARDRANLEGGGSGGLLDVWVLDVRWRVHPEAGEPYELREERRAPLWVKPGALSAGKRSFSLRVRPQHGLQAEVPIPCFVDPGDPHDLWVDWDAAYELHEPVWERMARVEREVNRQRGGVDAFLDRIGNPFAGKARPEDAAYVEQARAAADREPEAGRQCVATVISVTRTPRQVDGIPVHAIVLDVHDGGTVRRVVHEHTAAASDATRFKVGMQVGVVIDPGSPSGVALLP